VDATSNESVVYDHCDGMPDNHIGTYKAKCKHCNDELSGNGKATSNLVTIYFVNYHVCIR